MSEQPRIAPPSKDFLDARRRENAPPPPPGADESGWQWIREYEVWPGRNVFCCFGHLMTGPVEDIGPNSCAWFLLLTPMVLFFFTWGVTLWYASLPLFVFVCACFASAIFWLVVTGFMDPGIIPRNDDPEIDSQPPPPLYRERVDDDGNTVSDTWCHTCKIYRPPRASHCSDCDNCVLEFDHHCPFTRNCIGARNYTFFILFLCSVSLSLGPPRAAAARVPARPPPRRRRRRPPPFARAAALLFSCVLLGDFVAREALTHPDPDDPTASPTVDQLQLGSMVNTSLILFSAILSLLLWSFTGYHVCLVLHGCTTKEHLKGRKHGARKLHAGERIDCCGLAPSAVNPRRWVKVPATHCPPVINYSEL